MDVVLEDLARLLASADRETSAPSYIARDKADDTMFDHSPWVW